MSAKYRQQDWELMLPADFKFYKFCNCGGTAKYKYRTAGGFELHIMPNKNIFKCWLGGGRPGPSGYIEMMGEKLKAL